jgi:hypothetical protein
MVCYNGERPFSLDAKIPDLDQYLPQHKNIVEADYYRYARKKGIPQLPTACCNFLVNAFTTECTCRGNIGTTRQLKLYSAMGFEHLVRLLARPVAEFQPMFITLKNLRHDFKNVNLTTGPVGITRQVQKALEEPPVSHRSIGFREIV